MRATVGTNQPLKTIPLPSRYAAIAVSGAAFSIVAVASISAPAAALDLSPLTNTLSGALDKPLNSLPIAGPALAKTTDNLLNTTVPSTVGSLTKNLPAPVNNTLDGTVKSVNAPVQKITGTAQPLLNGLADTTTSLTKSLPAPVPALLTDASVPVNTVTDAVQPLLTDTVPKTANVVSDAAAPVTHALAAPLRTVTNTLPPALPISSRPPAPRSTLPVSSDPSAPGHHRSPAPQASHAPASDAPFSTVPVVGSVADFLRSFPRSLRALANYVASKRVDSAGLIAAATILAATMLVLIGAIYLMISRAKYGLAAISGGVEMEGAFYRNLLLPAGVGLIVLLFGTAAAYLVLIGL